MPRSALFGRRIHIAGSIWEDLSIATPAEVQRARDFVKALVLDLLSKGANFVVPVDAEKLRPDGQPFCFDWLVWEAMTSTKSAMNCVAAVRREAIANQRAGAGKACARRAVLPDVIPGVTF